MSKFQSEATSYDHWFDRHPGLFQSELAAIRMLLPTFQNGVEIGVGTGRFAAALGIRHGLEPLEEYAKIARSRGIGVREGVAEQMPYADASFDLALMVTVDCFLDDVPKAFAEAHRVLTPGGSFVVAFLDKNGAFAKNYEQSGKPAYQNAHFHSPEEIGDWLRETGFSHLLFAQTLFCENPLEVENPKPGSGEGGFVVVSGKKNAIGHALNCVVAKN
jgi:SAM-dependent methyltransferase